MSGELNLNTLLANMEPIMDDTEYVFVSFPEGEYGDGSHLNPMAMFMEKEGMTMIISKHAADHNNMAYESTFRCISLQVHSSLEAVGLTAAISKTLAEMDISANVVAAYYHDHVFVPTPNSEAAFTALSQCKGS